MKAGFVQCEPHFGKVDENLKKVETMIAGTDADLLVLPELFNTGYVFTSKDEVVALSEEIPEGKTTRALCDMARRNNVVLFAGLAEKEAGRYFNSSVLVSPQGYVATYRKVHLFFEETLWFDPGDGGFSVYDTGQCTVGLMICFDWIFPEATRALALQGAHIICHSANLVLPFCQDAMKTRCLENRVFAITANRIGTETRGEKSLLFTGKSQITGPGAEILYQAKADSEEVGIVDIDIAMAANKRLNEYNDLFGDRRTEFYTPLLNETQ